MRRAEYLKDSMRKKKSKFVNFVCRMVFGMLGFLSAIATFLTPLAADLGFFFILIMRVLQGARACERR